MDLFVYILLFAKFVLFIVFAIIKIFWFVFAFIGVRVVVNILRKWHGYNNRCNNYSRDSDIIDLFPTNTEGDSVYSVEFNRPSVKRISDDN